MHRKALFPHLFLLVIRLPIGHLRIHNTWHKQHRQIKSTYTDEIEKYLYSYENSTERLEAAQMKFLRHLLGITKLDKEKNQSIRKKNRSTEHGKGNKTVPAKVATTCTVDGHRQTTKAGPAL
jgi:hypothetical protein